MKSDSIPSAGQRACPVCGAAGGPPHPFSSDVWRVVRCGGCGMIYLANPPAQSALAEEFAWEHTARSERQKRRQGRRLYYLVSDFFKRVKHWLRRSQRKERAITERLCPRSGSLLDVGCASGNTLRALAESPGQFRLFGIEPSPTLAKRAGELCQTRGGHVEQATALAGLPRLAASSMDLVVMRSYLEHEVYAGPVLREVIRVLKPGGAALIKVPNAACWNARLRGRRWPGVRHPDHVNYFTRRHLRQLVSDSGFAECRFLWSSLLPTSDNLWAVARRPAG